MYASSKSETKLYKNVIDGRLVEYSNGKVMDSIDPSNGQVFAKIPLSTVEDAEKTIQAAKNASKNWASLTADQRAHYLRQIGDSFDTYGQELAQLETQDTGWVIRETSYGLIPILKQIWHDAAAATIQANRGETVPLNAYYFWLYD